jgi:hypothetical protein
MQALKPQDTRELRRYGLGLAAVVVIASWLVIPWLRERPMPAWPLMVGGVLALLALAWPAGVWPVHRALLPMARLLAVVNTWLLLGAVFFGILLPVGWALRRFGRLQYRTGFEPDLKSYRVDVPADHASRLEEPF